MPRKLPRRLTCEVTQADIDGATRRDSGHCAVADALRRTYPQASRIAVDMQAVRLSVDGERRYYWTPPAIQRYLIAFDAGDPIAPRSVVLSNLAQVRQAGHANRNKTAATMGNPSAGTPVKVGGGPLPLLGAAREGKGRRHQATRGYGARMMRDNQPDPTPAMG